VTLAVPDPRPTLVVLPGLDGTDVFLRPFIAALPSTVRTRFVPFPATGGNTYDDLLQIVQAAVADFPSFYVLASSFSGPLAVTLAVACPARVKGIIFAASFVKSPRPDLAPFRAAFVAPLVWTVRLLRRVPLLTRSSRSIELRRGKAETWARVGASTIAARTRQLLATDMSARFAETQHPVLCLTFEHDRVVTADCAGIIGTCRPTATFITLPGDHYGLFLHPMPAAAAVVQFIESHEALNGTSR
jgi:pimeloyl-ACP methyl ester carboxylesterase